jgi:hypothetical protein
MTASLFGEEASLDGVILRFLEEFDVIKDNRCTSGVIEQCGVEGNAVSRMVGIYGLEPKQQR